MFFVVAAAALALAGPAAADETISAMAVNRFSPEVTTIDQGERVSFSNLDFSTHNVTASGRGDDGNPLFASDQIGAGESGPVRGTEYLTTGGYEFVCTLHPGMGGTLQVSSAGTPLTRPDPPPQLTLKVLSSDLQKVVRSGRLAVRVAVNEAAAVKLTARARFGRKSISLGGGSATFARGSTRALTIKLSSRARRALAGARRASVTVSGVATDAGGQTTRKSASRTLD